MEPEPQRQDIRSVLQLRDSLKMKYVVKTFEKKILDSSSKDNLFFSFAPHAFGKEGPPEKNPNSNVWGHGHHSRQSV